MYSIERLIMHCNNRECVKLMMFAQSLQCMMVSRGNVTKYLQVIFTVDLSGNVQRFPESQSSFIVVSNNQVVLTQAMSTHT